MATREKVRVEDVSLEEFEGNIRSMRDLEYMLHSWNMYPVSHTFMISMNVVAVYYHDPRLAR